MPEVKGCKALPFGDMGREKEILGSAFWEWKTERLFAWRKRPRTGRRAIAVRDLEVVLLACFALHFESATTRSTSCEGTISPLFFRCGAENFAGFERKNSTGCVICLLGHACWV